MLESKLNFDASTRTMKKEAVSVRRNMPKKLTNVDSKTSESLSASVLFQEDMSLDQVPESSSVSFICSMQSSKGKHLEDKEREDDDNDDDDDDEFIDALDTLSLKHNTSGDVEAMKSPMPFEKPQPRDFMLDRFLPAAKSMTVEQQHLQYALKRLPLPFKSEPMRQIRDILPAETHLTPKRYESMMSPSYYHGIDVYEESEEDTDDDEVSDYLSKKGCGMMSPQLCFKNSLSMLSPMHNFKEKPYSLSASSHDHVKSSKVAQLKSRFQSVKKLALDSFNKQKMGSRVQSPVHSSFGKKYNFGSEQLESNLKTTSRPVSPYRQSSCMSPYRSAANSSPLHPAGFPETRKDAEIMRANRLNNHIRNIGKPQELLYPKSTRKGCLTSSVSEKTLYVNTENCSKASNYQSYSTVKNLPATVETISEEPEIAGKKPKSVLQLQTVETLSSSSKIKKMKANELEKKNSSCDLSPLVPPPPKKPSDSWLFRNMPSISSKIPSRRYLFDSQKKDLEENSTSVTYWETIVKTSYTHRDHIRYSEVKHSKFNLENKETKHCDNTHHL